MGKLTKLKSNNFRIHVKNNHTNWTEDYTIPDLQNSLNSDIKQYFKEMIKIFNSKIHITDNIRTLTKVEREYIIKSKTTKKEVYYKVGYDKQTKTK